MDHQIIQQMVAEAMNLPVSEITVVIHESLLLAAAIGGAVIGGGLSALSKHSENKKARKRAKRDKLLQEERNDFFIEQATDMHGEGGLVRQQAQDAYAHAETEHGRGHEQLNFSWEQAQQGYNLQIAGLDYRKDRAEEGIDRQDLGNKAALGAFGMRGGSSRGRANQDISNAREDVAFGYNQNKTQLDMGLTAAQRQVGWGREQLDQGLERAGQSLSYVNDQADMALEAAQKGHGWEQAAMDNAMSDLKKDTNGWTVLTAGISGAMGGAQTGMQLYSFDQMYNSGSATQSLTNLATQWRPTGTSHDLSHVQQWSSRGF